jgi:hypothetical protein
MNCCESRRREQKQIVDFVLELLVTPTGQTTCFQRSAVSRDEINARWNDGMRNRCTGLVVVTTAENGICDAHVTVSVHLPHTFRDDVPPEWKVSITFRILVTDQLKVWRGCTRNGIDYFCAKERIWVEV